VSSNALGPILHSFFIDHLAVQKGLRPSSVRSYRDMMKLLLPFVAADKGSRVSRLVLEDFTLDRLLRFLRHLEEVRGNGPRTRNQRLAALHTFFEYVANRVPEMVAVCQQIASIPTKRSALPEIRYLERDEISALLEHVPADGRWALRDRALLTFLYNTGARAQEAADLRVGDLDLAAARVRLRGKGEKWRTCPLWCETVRLLSVLLADTADDASGAPVFASFGRRPLTRVGVYRVVCRHARRVESNALGSRGRRITPHVLRHTTAVHLLESGVETNVIRAWLGHASLATTDRYAEITVRTKEAALRVCEPPPGVLGSIPQKPPWRSDPALLRWLASL
jgi:site-specific recombinase XerD